MPTKSVHTHTHTYIHTHMDTAVISQFMPAKYTV